MAFEMAHQLHAPGERVELLGLLDAYLRDDIVHMQRNDSMRMRLNRSIASLLGHLSPSRSEGRSLTCRRSLSVEPWAASTGSQPLSASVLFPHS